MTMIEDADHIDLEVEAQGKHGQSLLKAVFKAYCILCSLIFHSVDKSVFYDIASKLIYIFVILLN